MFEDFSLSLRGAFREHHDAVLNPRLDASPYLNGDAFTLADIATRPWFVRYELHEDWDRAARPPIVRRGRRQNRRSAGHAYAGNYCLMWVTIRILGRCTLSAAQIVLRCLVKLNAMFAQMAHRRSYNRKVLRMLSLF
ncbi:hypothetical protein [Paraburkholderia hospita]|jgi:hypothetical protein|uniref:hypothetical protein n=1 Tax=Paraburkholderia hospita TaxID=169430 RepID=UPI001054F77D|nr:hypothetical protein [Paraburkholderia hospita]